MNITRKNFFLGTLAATASGFAATARDPVGKIQGFDESDDSKTEGPWQPFSDRKVRVDIETALNTTVAGVYAHLSALKGGETLKIPEFSLKPEGSI